MAAGDEQDLIEAVVTCEGNLHDPDFQDRFRALVDKLKTALYISKTKDPFRVRKIEPWNSVRVTISIPKEAAQKLKLLAQQGSNVLRSMGILSVQVEGDQVISLTWAAHNNEATQVILRQTSDDSAGSSGTSGVSSSSLPASSPSISSISSSVASISSPVPLTPGCSGESSGISGTLEMLSSSSSAFRSPNVVAPSGEAIPILPPKASASGIRPSLGGPFPFVSMTHAAQAIQRNELNPMLNNIVISSNTTSNSNAANSTNSIASSVPSPSTSSSLLHGTCKPVQPSQSSSTLLPVTISSNNVVASSSSPSVGPGPSAVLRSTSVGNVVTTVNVNSESQVTRLIIENPPHPVGLSPATQVVSNNVASLGISGNVAVSQAGPSQSLQLQLVNVPPPYPGVNTISSNHSLSSSSSSSNNNNILTSNVQPRHQQLALLSNVVAGTTNSIPAAGPAGSTLPAAMLSSSSSTPSGEAVIRTGMMSGFSEVPSSGAPVANFSDSTSGVSSLAQPVSSPLLVNLLQNNDISSASPTSSSSPSPVSIEAYQQQQQQQLLKNNPPNQPGDSLQTRFFLQQQQQQQLKKTKRGLSMDGASSVPKGVSPLGAPLAGSDPAGTSSPLNTTEPFQFAFPLPSSENSGSPVTLNRVPATTTTIPVVSHNKHANVGGAGDQGAAATTSALLHGRTIVQGNIRILDQGSGQIRTIPLQQQHQTGSQTFSTSLQSLQGKTVLTGVKSAVSHHHPPHNQLSLGSEQVTNTLANGPLPQPTSSFPLPPGGGIIPEGVLVGVGGGDQKGGANVATVTLVQPVEHHHNPTQDVRDTASRTLASSASSSAADQSRTLLPITTVKIVSKSPTKASSNVNNNNGKDSDSKTFIPPPDPRLSSQVQRLSHSNSVSAKNSSSASAASSVANVVVQTTGYNSDAKSSTSQLHPAAGRTATMVNKRSPKDRPIPFQGPIHPSGKPRQFLINPLTGHLEPMSNESSSEGSEGSEGGDALHGEGGGEGRKSNSHKGSIHRNKMGRGALLPPGIHHRQIVTTESGVTVARVIKQPIDPSAQSFFGEVDGRKTSHGKGHGSLNSEPNPGSGLASIVSVSKKPREDSTTAAALHISNQKDSKDNNPSPATVTATSVTGEKIKLRLKLEKSEPISPAYKVDVSFVKKSEKGSVLPSNSATSGSASTSQTSSGQQSASAPDQPRVPPLHISLRGKKGAAVVVSPRREENKDTTSNPGNTKDPIVNNKDSSTADNLNSSLFPPPSKSLAQLANSHDGKSGGKTGNTPKRTKSRVKSFDGTTLVERGFSGEKGSKSKISRPKLSKEGGSISSRSSGSVDDSKESVHLTMPVLLPAVVLPAGIESRKSEKQGVPPPPPPVAMKQNAVISSDKLNPSTPPPPPPVSMPPLAPAGSKLESTESSKPGVSSSFAAVKPGDLIAEVSLPPKRVTPSSPPPPPPPKLEKKTDSGPVVDEKLPVAPDIVEAKKEPQQVPVPVPVPTPSETCSSNADEEEQKPSPGLAEVAPSSMSADTDQLPQVDQVFKGAFSTEIPPSTDVSGSDKEERNVVDKVVGEHHDDSQIDVSSSKDASVVNPVINLPTVSCDIKTSSDESQNVSEKRDDDATELEQRGALPSQKESPPDVVPSGSEATIPSGVAVPMDVDEESPPNIANESNLLEVVPTTSTSPPAEILTTNEGQGEPTCSDISGLTEHQQSSENQSNHIEQITPPEMMEVETPSEEQSKSNSETREEDKSGISQVSAIEEPSTSVTEATIEESTGTEPCPQVIEEPKTEEETTSTILPAAKDLTQVLETQQLEPAESIRTPDTESVPVAAVAETFPDGGNQTHVEKSNDVDESKSGTSTTENAELPAKNQSDNEMQTNVERVDVPEEVDASSNMPSSPKNLTTEENASNTGDHTSQTESMQVQPVPEMEAATVESLPSEIQPVVAEAPPPPIEDSTKEEIPVKNDEADVINTPVSNQSQLDVKMEETTENQSEEPKDIVTNMDQQEQEPTTAPQSQDDSHLHPPPAIAEESQEESKEIPNSDDSSLPQKEDPVITPENETPSGTETEKLEKPAEEVESTAPVQKEAEIKPEEPTIVEKNSETITEPQEQQTSEPVAQEEAVPEAMDEVVPDVKPEVAPESEPATPEEKMDETDEQSEDISIKAIPPQIEGQVHEEPVRNEVPALLPIVNEASKEELPEECVEAAAPIESEESHQEQETAKHETQCTTDDALPSEKSQTETVAPAPAKTEEKEDEVISEPSTEEPSETISDEPVKLQLDSGNNNQTSATEIPEETKEPVLVTPTKPPPPIMPQLIPVTRPSSTKQSKDKKLLLESTEKVSTSDSTNIVVTAVATSSPDPVSVTIMTPKMPEVPASTTNNPPISIVLPSDRSGGNGDGKTSKNSYKRRAEIKPGALQNTLKRLHSVLLPKSGSDSEEGPMPTGQANMVVAEVDGHAEIPEAIVETPPAAATPPPPTIPNAVTITPNAKQPEQSFTTVTAQPQPVNIAVSHVRSMQNVVQHPKVILPPTSGVQQIPAGLQSNFLANVSTALTSALSSMGSITVTSSSGGQPQTVFAIHPNMSIPANFAHLQQSPVMLPRGHKMVPIKLVTLPKQSGGQLQTIPIGNATPNRSSPNLLEAVNIVANAGSRSSSPKATLIGNAMQSSPLNLSSVSLPVGGNLHFVPISVSSATGTTGNVKVLMTQPIKMQQSGLSQSMVVKSVMMGNQPTTIRVIRPANLQEPISLHTLIKPPEQLVNAVPKQKSETPVVVIESSTRKNDFSLQQDLFKKLDGVEIVDTGSPLNNDDLPFEADIIHDEKDLADVLAAEAKTEIISMDNCTNYHVEVKTSKEVTAKKGGNAVSPEINTGMSTKSIQNHVSSKKAHKINREETTTPDSPAPVMRVTSPLFTYSAKQSQDKRPTPLSPSSSPNPERPDLHGEDQEIINSFSRSPSQPRLSPQIKPRTQDGSSDGKSSGGGEFLPDHTYGLNLTNCDSNSIGQELLIEIPPVDLEVAAALSPSQNQLEEKRCTRSTRSNTRLSPDITAFVSDTQKPSKLSLKTDSLSMKNSPKPSPTGSLKVLSPTPSSLTITPSTSTRSSPISHNQHQNASDAEATIDAVSLGIIHKIQGNTGGQSVKNSRLSKQPGANKRKRQESDSSSASRDENVEEKTEIDLNSRPGKRKCSENAAEMIKVCIGVEDSPKRNISTVKKTDDAKVKDNKGKKAMATVLEDDDDIDSEVSLSRGRSGRSSRESSEDRSSSRGSSAQRVVAGDKSKSVNAKEEEPSKDAKTSRVNSRVGKEAGAKLKSQASGRVSPHPSATPAKKAREAGKTPVRRPNRPNSKDKSPLTPAKTRTNVRKDITAQTPTEKTSTGGTHSGTNPENENARRKTRSSAAVDTSDSEISNVKRRRLSKDANN